MASVRAVFEAGFSDRRSPVCPILFFLAAIGKLPLGGTNRVRPRVDQRNRCILPARYPCRGPAPEERLADRLYTPRHRKHALESQRSVGLAGIDPAEGGFCASVSGRSRLNHSHWRNRGWRVPLGIPAGSAIGDGSAASSAAPGAEHSPARDAACGSDVGCFCPERDGDRMRGAVFRALRAGENGAQPTACARDRLRRTGSAGAAHDFEPRREPNLAGVCRLASKPPPARASEPLLHDDFLFLVRRHGDFDLAPR